MLRIIGSSATKGASETIKHMDEQPPLISLSAWSHITIGTITAIEFGYYSYKLVRGTITWKEYGRQVLRICSFAGCTYGASVSGGIAGAKGGAIVGSLIGSIGSPLGSLIGAIIGSIIASLVAGFTIDYVWRKYWPPEEKTKQLIYDAFVAFNFKENDVEDKKEFNAELIKERYETRYNECRKVAAGIDTKIREVTIQYGILTAILDKLSKNEKSETKKLINTVLNIERSIKSENLAKKLEEEQEREKTNSIHSAVTE